MNINVETLKYLGSFPNTYEYKGVCYRSCDLIFHAGIEAFPTHFDETEVQELVLLNPSEIPDDEIAFESIRRGLNLFRHLKSQEKYRTK
ncbi:MAG: NUDIX hydrolase [Planctomycetota bacterium]